MDVADRDPTINPSGFRTKFRRELHPGIVCDDVAAIFEEHKIVPALDPFVAQDGFVFSRGDNAFSFGPVIAEMAPDASGDGDGDGADDADAGLAQAPPKPRAGVSANFKISNASKVPCSVEFTLTPKVEGGASEEAFPMEVHPSRLDVPPHEHRYVTAYFAPTAIGNYAATFEANVVDGGDPKTKQFACDIVGEGTLPHVSIETPAESNEEGAPVIRFPRAMIGRRATRPIVLRNDGILPAFCRVDMPKSDVFSLVGGGVTSELAPGHTRTLQLSFEPREVGDFSHSARLAVKRNQFGARTVAIVGEGYAADVVFGDHAGDVDDEIRFEDGPLGAERAMTFTMSNVSEKHWRFEWPEPTEGSPTEFFAFSPRTGHLHAGTPRPSPSRSSRSNPPRTEATRRIRRSRLASRWHPSSGT